MLLLSRTIAGSFNRGITRTVGGINRPREELLQYLLDIARDIACIGEYPDYPSVDIAHIYNDAVASRRGCFKHISMWLI